MVSISLLVVAATVACMTTSATPFFGLLDYDICDDCAEDGGGLSGIMCDLMCETVESSEEGTTKPGDTTTGGSTSSAASEATTGAESSGATTAAAAGETTTAAAGATTAAAAG